MVQENLITDSRISSRIENIRCTGLSSIPGAWYNRCGPSQTVPLTHGGTARRRSQIELVLVTINKKSRVPRSPFFLFPNLVDTTNY